MPDTPRPGLAPLAEWVTLHPQALAVARGEASFPAVAGARPPRSAALAAALAACNRDWGNPVDGELAGWLAGSEVVVTGQQPGLLGGPLLSLVKACTVAAEVSRRRAAGHDAIGFFWVATADDDLAEMGWARVANGEDVLLAREEGWARGGEVAAEARLSGACTELLESLGERATSDHARAALAHAARCYPAGAALGDATARFLAPLLAGLGVVVVDACEEEVARAAAPALLPLLGRLSEAWAALEDGAQAMRRRGWPVPLHLARGKLPLFRRVGTRRESIPAYAGTCPPSVLAELAAAPERFLPNAWLRPLAQDAALDSGTAVLGGAELAYHVQAAALWGLAGVGRPAWRLRPHVTVVTAAERRLLAQLGLAPADLLRSRPPRHVLPGAGVRKELRAIAGSLERRMKVLEARSDEELPALRADLEATATRLHGGLRWLEERVEAAATRTAEVEMARWRKLRAFLRPGGKPQERDLSVLAPLLRLGLEWPRRLAEVIDPTAPGMHLLHLSEGGPW